MLPGDTCRYGDTQSRLSLLLLRLFMVAPPLWVLEVPRTQVSISLKEKDEPGASLQGKVPPSSDA